MQFNNPPVIIDKKAIYTVVDFDLPTYKDFLKIRTIPHYKINKNTITFDASYIDHVIQTQSKLPIELQEGLFDYQEVISKVAFYKERYAVYADAGLGKTAILYQLALLILSLSKKSTGKIIICVPLPVLHQFMEMADFFDVMPPMINLHNNREMTLKEWCYYDDVPRIGFINHHAFIKPQELKNIDGFLLDECHILRGGKGGDGKIAKHLVESCKDIRYKIAASATPAPNDPAEYGMVELWLGLCDSFGSFLGDWFVQKEQKLQLKRHSHHRFYAHLASYSIFIKDPKVYGFQDNLANLPPYKEIHKRIELTPGQEELIKDYALDKQDQMMLPGLVYKPSGVVKRNKFSEISKGFIYLKDENDKRIIKRVKSNKPQAILDCVQFHYDEQIIVAVYFDEEGVILHELLSDNNIDCVHLTGKNKLEEKVNILNEFRHGKIRVLIAQVGLISTGLNLQFCRINIISGMTDSYAEHYQFKKRTHRFGQEKEVLFYYFYTSYEEAILTNVLGKEAQHNRDIAYQERLYKDSLYEELKDFLELGDYTPMKKQKIQYEPFKGENYQIYHGDAKKILFNIKEGLVSYDNYGWLQPDSIDLSVQSPPFPALDKMTYSSDEADMSNHRNSGALASKDEFLMDMRFWYEGMYAVHKPGRYMYVHVEDVPFRKNLDGMQGIFDFPGYANMVATEAGWILKSKVSVLKNQQMQGGVKHVSNLQMVSMAKDRLRISPAMNGYLYIYQKPGISNDRLADIYKCRKCGNEGYCSDLLGYNIELAKKQVEVKMPHYATCLCPRCKTNNPLIFSEMDGDKWVMYAEGGWVDGCFDDNFKHWASEKKADRWADIFRNFADILYGHLGVWPDINEFDILKNPFRGAKNANDLEDADKHLAPLPYTIARRAIILHSKPDDLILTSFMGCGTEVVEALRLGRRAIGLELNPTYYQMAYRNIEEVIAKNQQYVMFPELSLEIA